MTVPDPPYVCGYSRHEFERLATQGAYYEEISRRFLEDAGLAPGMRVLDVGCGTGDLSFVAAELVGPSGHVLGIDHAPEPLDLARARARSKDVSQVEFRRAEVADLQPDRPADALIARFVLMHQGDPAETLRAAARHVRAGGIVVFIESYMDGLIAGVHSRPHSPTYDRIVRILIDVIGAAGAHNDMGLRLRNVFVDAGLPAPELRLQARAEGGPDAAIYRYITDSLRSMLPLARQFGIADLSSQDVDVLEQELRDEVMSSGGVLTSPPVVGAWCRLP